jgi:hypothetical protein
VQRDDAAQIDRGLIERRIHRRSVFGRKDEGQQVASIAGPTQTLGDDQCAGVGPAGCWLEPKPHPLLPRPAQRVATEAHGRERAGRTCRPRASDAGARIDYPYDRERRSERRRDRGEGARKIGELIGRGTRFRHSIPAGLRENFVEVGETCGSIPCFAAPGYAGERAREHGERSDDRGQIHASAQRSDDEQHDCAGDRG